MTANLHTALANPSSAIETCRMPNPFREELYVEPLRMDGCILPPVAPGLGIELTDRIRERYPYTGQTGHHFDWTPAVPIVTAAGDENATSHHGAENR